MRSRNSLHTRLAALLLPVLAMFPLCVYAQGLIVDDERLDDWFYSRLAWGALIGLIIGALVGALHLARLKFSVSSLHINGLARRRFGIWLIVVFVLVSILLQLDIWKLYPFSAASLTFSEALVQGWFNYRTFLVLLVVLATFSVSVAVTTRVTPGSHCPYAFIPGPRGK